MSPARGDHTAIPSKLPPPPPPPDPDPDPAGVLGTPWDTLVRQIPTPLLLLQKLRCPLPSVIYEGRSVLTHWHTPKGMAAEGFIVVVDNNSWLGGGLLQFLVWCWAIV